MIRPKVLILLLLAVVICGAVLFLVSRVSSRTGSHQPGARVEETATDPLQSQPQSSEQASLEDKPTGEKTVENDPLTPPILGSATNMAVTQNVQDPMITNSVPAEMTPEAIENLIATKVEQLQDLSTKSDQASMEAILAEVKSSYAEVRAEAVEAIIQFRSRDAIPALKQLAAQTEDTREKAAILEAIEFLELPTLEEFIEASKRQGQQDAKKSLDASGRN